MLNVLYIRKHEQAQLTLEAPDIREMMLFIGT